MEGKGSERDPYMILMKKHRLTIIIRRCFSLLCHVVHQDTVLCLIFRDVIREKLFQLQQERKRLRRLILPEQFIPGDILARERIADIIEQNGLRILNRDLLVAVDIACKLLLFCQIAVKTCHCVDILEQCKLCVLDDDLAVIIDVAGQVFRFGRCRITCCRCGLS